MSFEVASLALTAMAGLIFFFRFSWTGSQKHIDLKNPLVIDGDTIFSNQVKYRLHGIDAPETGQRHGDRAKKHLERLIGGRTVRAEKMDVDTYGRQVVRLHGKGGDLCRLMVLNGYAIASYHEDYKRDEVIARRKKNGLWAKGGISDPSAWRQGQTRVS
jgi:endonuclease YncB( thermonuclease family)